MSGVKKPIKHGTRGGYLAHRRRERPAATTCASCLRAWRFYYNDRNQTLPRAILNMRKRADARKAAQHQRELMLHNITRRETARLKKLMDGRPSSEET